MKTLLFGASGWIGSQLLYMLPNVVVANSRLDHYPSIIAELECVRPTHVVLAAGLTGRPNVDWCEDHHYEVLSTNVIGTSVLADHCHRLGIHLTYLGTGCIYEYDSSHPTPFTEQDQPNFDKSYYSKTKILTEKIIKEYPNVLILRLRMPLSDDLHPRSLITKLLSYEKVVNIPNSMSVLYDLLPLVPEMSSRQLTGIYNFVNPGVISHNEILDLYKEYIDPNFTYRNFSLEEQSKVIKAGRSNNHLDATKLLEQFEVPHIQDSIRQLFKRMKSGVSSEDYASQTCADGVCML